MSSLVDLLDREAAVSTFDRPVLVVAGAGTGKTALLVARLIAWLAGEGWDRFEATEAGSALDPEALATRLSDRVAAITFTEAAAAEMAARYAKALADLALGAGVPPGLEALAKSSGPVLAERSRILLGVADRVRLSTIHGFAQRLLSHSPLEAGLHPAFRIDPEGMELDELIEDHLRAVLGGDQIISRRVVALGIEGIDLATLRDALRTLVIEAVPLAAIGGDPFSPERVEAMVGRLRSSGRELLTMVESAEGAKGKAGEVVAMLRGLGEREAVGGFEDFADLIDWAADRHEDLKSKLGTWSKGSLTKGELECLGELPPELARVATDLRVRLAHVAGLDAEVLPKLNEVLSELYGDIEAERQRRGLLGFSHLLEGVDRLLAQPDVAAEQRGALDQLLVDEFQDTDLRQCRLLRRLGLEGEPDQRPGLFLVGDPKQSIYGWRSADLEAYDAFATEVEEAGGLSCTLRTNFRSSAAVLAEVERSVAPVMKPLRGVQPAFESLETAPDRSASLGLGGRVPIEIWSLPSGEKLDEEWLAEALASDIAGLIDAGVKAGEIAVLSRRRSALGAIAEALRRRRLAHDLAGSADYYRRPEVIEAAALVRAVLDPVDLLAAVAALRSPVVGIPDAAWPALWRGHLPELLVTLSGADDPRLVQIEALVTEVAASIAEAPGVSRIASWPALAVHALRAIAILRGEIDTLDGAGFVDRLAQLLPLEAAAAAAPQGPWRLANLSRLLRRLAEQIDACAGTPRLALRALERSVREARDEGEARPLDESTDRIKLLTIHGAKGLGFGHVYLVDLAASGRGRVRAHAVENLSSGIALRLAGRSFANWDEAALRRRRVAEAERVRLFYVALTRAKERLVLVGHDPGGTTGFNELLRSRSCDGALEISTEEEGSEWRSDDVLRRELPSIAAVSTPRPEAIIESPEDEELVLPRGVSSLRAQRPWLLPASALASEDDAGQRAGSIADAATLRAAGRAVGTAMHRAFELLDLDGGDLDTEARRALDALRLGRAARDLAEIRMRQLLLSLTDGRLLRRFSELEVLARELPLVAPPSASKLPEAEAPVAAFTGTIDLLARDPSTGELLVIDFKSDRIAGRDTAALAEHYRPQLELYAAAVSQALALPEPPACELWLLESDEVLRI